MAKLHSTQVETTRYKSRTYLTLPRIITHWHQANEVANSIQSDGSILEIGSGTGHVTWMLRSWGYDVTTLDFDANLKPSVIGDITKIPFEDNAFDCVLAAEVLEHIPFEEFDAALMELKRIARQSVIITLPAPFAGLSALINLPFIEPIGVFLGVPHWVNHKFNGEHYWELGKRGFEINKIKRIIEKQGFNICRKFRPSPSLYCYFFVLTL